MSYIKYSDFDPSKLVLEVGPSPEKGVVSYQIKYPYQVKDKSIIEPLKVLAPEVCSKKGLLKGDWCSIINTEFNPENKENKDFITEFCQKLHDALLCFAKKELGEVTLGDLFHITRDKNGEIILASNYFNVNNKCIWYSHPLGRLDSNDLVDREIAFEPFIVFPTMIFNSGKGVIKSNIYSAVVKSTKPVSFIL